MSVSIALTWRRAWNGGENPAFIGDQRLASVLRFHREVQTLGFLRAVRSSSAEERKDAKLGYEYVGLPEVSSTLARAERILRSGEDLRRLAHGLDVEYNELLSDDKLYASFTACYRMRPSDFSSVF